MHTYRRKTSPRAAVVNRDLQKRPLYDRVDLLVRSLSALGLLLLGLAGWMLQVEVQRRQQKIEEIDRSSRQYLPLFRAFTELELTTEETLDALSWKEFRDSPETRRVISRLNNAVLSTAVAERDPVSAITLPNVSTDLAGRPVRRVLPVRATATLVVDILALLAFDDGYERDRPEATSVKFAFHPSDGAAAISSRDGVEIATMPVSEDSVKIWREWNGDRPAKLSYLQDMRFQLLRSLHRQVIMANQAIMTQSPHLGQQFVDIRAGVIAAHGKASPFTIPLTDSR